MDGLDVRHFQDVCSNFVEVQTGQRGLQLLEAGIHDKAVADILGHSDTRMTARYTHTSNRYARDAMTGLAAALGSVAAPVAANGS